MRGQGPAGPHWALLERELAEEPLSDALITVFALNGNSIDAGPASGSPGVMRPGSWIQLTSHRFFLRVLI